MGFSFFRRWREKKPPKTQPPIHAQPTLPDDDMDWFYPPDDVHESAVWDRYWLDQAAHGLMPPLFDMFCVHEELIQCLRQRGARTVLCAGNGISQEPRALAAAGFDVTAMDLSPKAAHLAESWEFTPEDLDRFCPAALRTGGGSAKFTVGDILDRSACPGPFDAIIERRMLQLFPEEERGAGLDVLASRLQLASVIAMTEDGGRPISRSIRWSASFENEAG